jgi:hypothetical protein
MGCVSANEGVPQLCFVRLETLCSQPVTNLPHTSSCSPAWLHTGRGLTQGNLIQEENTDQILSDSAEHATNPAAAI